MTPGEAAPSVREIANVIQAQGTAGTVQDQTIGEAPFAGTVTRVRLVPEANVVGNASNFRTFRILNKGQSGAGSTVVATFSTNATPANDLVAFDEKDIPLSAVAGATTVAAGDVLAVDETVTGTGVAHAGYKVVIEITRTGGT